MTPREIADLINQMTVDERNELIRYLIGDEGGLGVPAVLSTPPPESPGDAIAQALPEDYWESAE